MTIERSHGKARPTLPRSGEGAAVRTVPDRSVDRDAMGRARAGNQLAKGRGYKRTLKRWSGFNVDSEQVEQLARDAMTLNHALLRDLPYDGPQIRPLVAARARSIVLSGYYANLGAESGLDTAEGRSAIELSMKLDQRAERLAVTALDIATKLAATDRSRPVDAHALAATVFAAPARMPSGERPPAPTTVESSKEQDASAGRTGPATGGDQ